MTPRRPPDGGGAARPPGTRQRGAAGEAAAARYLRRRGYRIEAANLRTRQHEIDLLVRRWRTFVAVEVKTRTRCAAPEAAVTEDDRQRLAAALLALAPQLRPVPRQLRVDVVAVRIDRALAVVEVRHFVGEPLLLPR